MGSFQAGVGRVDITPPLSAPHASWGAQVHVFAEDVDLPLTCTALVVDDGTTRAAWIDFDLIILSTHGHTGVTRAILGSTAEKVVRHASCPVLVVRKKEHEFIV